MKAPGKWAIPTQNLSQQQIEYAKSFVADKFRDFMSENCPAMSPIQPSVKVVGSRANGTNRPDSDLDILVSIPCTPFIMRTCSILDVSIELPKWQQEKQTVNEDLGDGKRRFCYDRVIDRSIATVDFTNYLDKFQAKPNKDRPVFIDPFIQQEC